MKKRHVVLLCIGVLVLLLTVLIVIKKIEDDQKYVIRGEIASVEVVDSLRRGPIETSDTEAISVLLNCIKDVQKNNRRRIRDIEQAPTFYEITVHFANGEDQTYEYRVYPSTAYEDPFGPFYDLFSTG